MDYIGQGPDHRDAKEGDAEKDDMEDSHRNAVGQPNASAVHHSGVGIHLTVSHSNIHSEKKTNWMNQKSDPSDNVKRIPV